MSQNSSPNGSRSLVFWLLGALLILSVTLGGSAFGMVIARLNRIEAKVDIVDTQSRDIPALTRDIPALRTRIATQEDQLRHLQEVVQPQEQEIIRLRYRLESLLEIFTLYDGP